MSYPKYPLLWSAEKIAQQELEVHSVSEGDFVHWSKKAQLLASRGDLLAARQAIEYMLEQWGKDLFYRNDHFFTEVVVAALVTCQYDIVYEAFAKRLPDNWSFSIEAAEGISSILHVMEWEVVAHNRSIFRFDLRVYRSDITHNIFLNWAWSYPLFRAYHTSGFVVPGRTCFTFGDMAAVPGLAFSGYQPDVFLVPDCIFLSQHGYRDSAAEIKRNERPWDQRAPVALWRGSTTGIKSGDWRTLQRVRLCQLAQQTPDTGWFDVGITTIAQMENPQWVAQIEQAGLKRAFVPVGKFGHYKYLIDIDGNSNAWQGLFTKLLTGSAVLKVASPRSFRQWYYDKLQPWVNYVPVQADMSDLVDNVRWLASHDDHAELIGKRGKALAESMTYDQELVRVVRTIREAFLVGSMAPVASIAMPQDGG